MADHRVFFEHDPQIGRTTWLVFDERGNLKGAHVEQDVDGILASNARARAATEGQKFGDWNHAARVPLTFLEKTGLDKAIDGGDNRYIGKILNDSDYSGFRTSRGRL